LHVASHQRDIAAISTAIGSTSGRLMIMRRDRQTHRQTYNTKVASIAVANMNVHCPPDNNKTRHRQTALISVAIGGSDDAY